MDPRVDDYISRSRTWPNEVEALRRVLLSCGLTEALKWSKPCYVSDGHNIAIIQEMKAFVALMFFSGALLDDPDGVLQDQGPNSRSAKRLVFTSVDDVARLRPSVETLVRSAQDVARSGRRLDPADPAPLSDVLQARLDSDTAFRRAFEALTPGRRRDYDLHISAATRETTRLARLDACVPRILAGRGRRDG